MIKIISKKEYEMMEQQIRDLIFDYNKLKRELIHEKADNDTLKKENITLKSKITKLENKIKKQEAEVKSDKQLVKETLKEVHKEHKKRVGRPRKENK